MHIKYKNISGFPITPRSGLKFIFTIFMFSSFALGYHSEVYTFWAIYLVGDPIVERGVKKYKAIFKNVIRINKFNNISGLTISPPEISKLIFTVVLLSIPNDISTSYTSVIWLSYLVLDGIGARFAGSNWNEGIGEIQSEK